MIDKKTAEALIIDRDCLQVKIDKLEQQLKDCGKWMIHRDNCGFPSAPGVCTCGLDKLLKGGKG